MCYWYELHIPSSLISKSELFALPLSLYSCIVKRQSNIKRAMKYHIKFTCGPCTMSMSVLPRDWRRALSSQSGSCKKGGRQQVPPLGYTMVDGNIKFNIPITQLLHTFSHAPTIQRPAKRRGCLLSYGQAEPGRELMQPSLRLLAEPCISLTFDWP